MAYIYRYQLRDVELRNSNLLNQYTLIIQSVLEEHFYKNLKDSFVEDYYFEFTLFASVTRGILQEMGRKLKSALPREINHFVRMEQTLYAIVYSARDNHQDDIHIEFIDSNIINNPELYEERANLFIEKFGRKNILVEIHYEYY